MKLRLILLRACNLFRPSVWRRRRRYRLRNPDLRLPPSGLLTAPVLRELFKQQEDPAAAPRPDAPPETDRKAL